MQRMLIIALAGLAALAATGCGTNSSTGLDKITLDPDLIPEKIEEASDQYVLGGAAKFNVTIANRGGASSRAFKVRAYGVYYFSQPLICGATSIPVAVTETVDGLLSNDAIGLEMTLSLPPNYTPPSTGYTGCDVDPEYDGSWEIQVDVDFNDDVRESDETNNTLSYGFVATASASGGGGTDLVEKLAN
ncbi:MAG: hypothetical protein PF961_00530 [Planctomycetota bacterium]|nr:hypothetical protein [Planctomycetota bacterium]